MVLQRWDPFTELRRMDDMMNRLWRGFTDVDGESRGPETWGIPLDVEARGDEVVVTASVPGIKPDDIQLSIEDNVLTIRAETRSEDEQKSDGYLVRERRAGNFYRALRLPDSVDPDRAESHYENGVLSIHFPKAESKKAKQIPVRTTTTAA